MRKLMKWMIESRMDEYMNEALYPYRNGIRYMYSSRRDNENRQQKGNYRESKMSKIVLILPYFPTQFMSGCFLLLAPSLLWLVVWQQQQPIRARVRINNECLLLRKRWGKKNWLHFRARRGATFRATSIKIVWKKEEVTLKLEWRQTSTGIQLKRKEQSKRKKKCIQVEWGSRSHLHQFADYCEYDIQ